MTRFEPAAGDVAGRARNQARVTLTSGGPRVWMPGMTMVFRVKDPAMLSQVKECDQVKFVADRVNGVVTVMQLEVAR